MKTIYICVQTVRRIYVWRNIIKEGNSTPPWYSPAVSLSTRPQKFKQHFVSFSWFHYVTSARKALIYRDSSACPEMSQLGPIYMEWGTPV